MPGNRHSRTRHTQQVCRFGSASKSDLSGVYRPCMAFPVVISPSLHAIVASASDIYFVGDVRLCAVSLVEQAENQIGTMSIQLQRSTLARGALAVSSII